MKKIFLILLLISCLSSALPAQEFPSLKTLNDTNLAWYFDDLLGYLYDSHGCLHFSPADIYLLTRIVPNGIPLRIKKYSYKEDKLPFSLAKVPYLTEITSGPRELEKHRAVLSQSKTEIMVLPGLNRLIIMIAGLPYAQVTALAGPEENLLMAFDVRPGLPIAWDSMLATPTDPGNYTLLRSTDHYVSNAYSATTVVPFGAQLFKKSNRWYFEKNNKLYKLPDYIAADLDGGLEQSIFNYYDVSIDANDQITSARWASHDFGKDVWLWTKDGKNYYDEMGYAAGGLLYEQIILVKDLVHLLTMPGPDDFDYLVSQNENFKYYKGLHEFVSSYGKTQTLDVRPDILAYYKIYNGLELTERDFELLDTRITKPFYEYRENRLPRDRFNRRQALGLYSFVEGVSQVIEKQAHWYEKIKNDWAFWRGLRIQFRKDFAAMGIMAQANMENVVEHWLKERLEFRLALLPTFAKNVGDLSFNSFFKPSETIKIYSEREEAIMLKMIDKVLSGEVTDLQLDSVDALNNYNFGLLLNEILGDLYKSHGCLHLSPRNAYFIYYLLPKGTQITVYGYDQKPDQAVVDNVPYLANLVNFQADLENLKPKFQSAKDVKIYVYPASGWWLIYLNGQPFAKELVKGGPQTKMYLMQERDEKGRPLFEDHLAYSTTPGTYYIFKKWDNYVSNIYYDTTVVPQGAWLKKEKDKWVFEVKPGKWQTVTKPIAEDLKYPPELQRYTYYDKTINASGEVVAMKWGSHPFGRYAVQTSKDFKTPFPELIHSSGALIMEERELINDLIMILSAPYDGLEDCAEFSPHFEIYKACYEFMRDPKSNYSLEAKERGAYKLYFDLPTTTEEVEGLAPDALIANKYLKGQPLTPEDVKLLLEEGIAYYRQGQLKINEEKILGLQYDTYQYVVIIQKYAHHYETLKNNWQELTGLRKALLKDFNNFVVKDPVVFHNFMRELMLRRTELKNLSQAEALVLLKEMLKEKRIN
ncbi:MAG: L,D-transpeptidase [bacterium]